MKAIIYCRVSSERQVKEGHGLESQMNRCLSYAKNNGYEVIKTFYEEGVSGKAINRPAINELFVFLEKIQEKGIIIIIDELSRLARSIETHLVLRANIKAKLATLECVNHKLEDNAEGKFIETILASTAELERELNKRRVSQRMASRIENGYWTFCPPTGLEYFKCPIHGKLLRPKYPEANIIKEALEGFANNLFLNQVDVQRFLEKNKDKLNKATIHLQFVNRLLTDILYSGYIEYPKWQISRKKGFHEGVISLDTYLAIQDKLKRPEPKVRATDKAEFPLRRLINCSKCGKKMTGSTSKGKRKYYSNYTCNNKLCTASPKNIQTYILEEKYIELLNQIKPEADLINLAKAIALDVWKVKIKDLSSENQDKEGLIRAKETEINKALDLILKASNETVKTYYEGIIEEKTNEINQLKNTYKKPISLDFETALEKVTEFIGTPSKFWINSDLEGKKMIHELIFDDQPTFSLEDGFGTPKLSLPFKLNTVLCAQNNQLVEMRGFEPRSLSGKHKRLL